MGEDAERKESEPERHEDEVGCGTELGATQKQEEKEIKSAGSKC